jgi:hypothetical protein
LLKGPHPAAPEEKEAKMYSSTYLDWFRRLLILGAVVAGLTASAAGAGIDSRPPGVMMALHFKHEDRMYGRTGGDLSDVASTPSLPVTAVSRPPDVQDAASALQRTPEGPKAGFDWDDWAIGIGTGLGLALLLGVGFMVGRQHRHRIQPA